MDEILEYLHIEQENKNEDTYKNIINHLTNEILQLKNELYSYKSFHDAILNNEVIRRKFNEYEFLIRQLKGEINILRNNN